VKFILFCEGETERKCVPQLLQRWLNTRLQYRVGIKPVLFDGWQELIKDSPKKANLYLNGPESAQIIGVIALLDLYGPTFYPTHFHSADEKYSWARAEMEKRVNHQKFRQYFAVHEIEAWLLSDPSIFSQRDIQQAIQKMTIPPETVNFQQPPAKLLEELFQRSTKYGYKKVTYGKQLFSKLNPEIAYKKCPYLGMMLDGMLDMAREAEKFS
jgi:hypothetical protein